MALSSLSVSYGHIIRVYCCLRVAYLQTAAQAATTALAAVCVYTNVVCPIESDNVRLRCFVD